MIDIPRASTESGKKVVMWESASKDKKNTQTSLNQEWNVLQGIRPHTYIAKKSRAHGAHPTK